MSNSESPNKLPQINFSSSESLDIPNITSLQPIQKPIIQTENPIPNPDITTASVTIESKPAGSGFKNFVIFGILLIIVIYGIVAYLYYKNTNLKEVVTGIKEIQISTPTPTPTFNPENVVIENGSVVYKHSDNKKHILVDKNSFPTTGITGFARVLVSPNEKLICFESIPPATKPSLIVADITGSNSKVIGANKSNCLWTKPSNQIIYSGKETGLGNVNIYIYDLNSSTEQNLTTNAILPPVDFSIVGLSSDESLIICNYTNTSTDETHQCQINIESGKFIFL